MINTPSPDQITTYGLPRQAIPFKQKNKEWREETVKSIAGLCNFSYSRGNHSKWRLIKWYEYYNNIVDEEDYHTIIKPYGKKIKLPTAEIRNLNIIKPVIDVLLGEFIKRPKEWSVIISNPDVNTIKLQEQSQRIKENLTEHFIYEMQRLGVVQNLSEEEEQPQLPQEVIREFNRSYKDARAIQGYEILRYIEFHQELNRKLRVGFFDFLVAGMVFSLKEVVHNEVMYTILNPLDVDYDKSPDVEFIEDGLWVAVRRQRVSSDLIDEYHDVLTLDQINQIENPNTKGEVPLLFGDPRSSLTRHSDRLVEEVKVFWKSQKKIGICRYTDIWGNAQKKEVDENYKKQPGEEIEWSWINEVWQGVQIDNDIFINIYPLPVQRGSLDNPSICKLPVNGRIYSERNAEFISLVGIGVAYQLLFNIYNYRIENIVAKARGVIAQLDLDYIPDGWDMDKYMYFIDQTGVAWQQRAKEGGIMPTHTHREVLDLSAKAIGDYIALMDKIIEEWERVSGVSRQRLGAMTQYDGKATSEQSIIQSSHITEDIFAKFEEFVEREYSGLLDISRIAFVTGKKGPYVLPDGQQGYLDVDGISNMESEYGIFFTSSAKEVAKINFIKQLSQQMVQAGWQPSLIADIIETDSFVGLKEKIREAEEIQSQLAQAQQQMEEEVLARQEQADQAKLQLDLQKAQIEAESKREQGVIEREKLEIERDKLNIEREKLDLERDIKEKELNLKQEEIDNDEEIAKKKLEVERIKARKSNSNNSK